MRYRGTHIIQEGSRTSRYLLGTYRLNPCMTWEANNCIVVLTLCKSMVGCLTCLHPTKPSSLSFGSGVRDHPKAVLAGGSVESPRPQNLIEPLKNGITEDHEG